MPVAAQLSERGRRLQSHGAVCRSGAADPFRDARRGADRSRGGAGPRSCSSPTPSTAISSRRISRRRVTVLGAAGCRVHAAAASRRTRGRSAADARSSRSAWSTRRAEKPSARSPRSRPSSPAACRWSGLSRAASSVSATRFRSGRKPSGAQARRAHCLFEEFVAREARPADYAAAEAARASARCCTAIAIRNPSERCPCEAVLQARAGPRGRHRSSRAAAAWPARFGYGADTIDVSLAMGELSLLPAVRAAPADALIVADGTSCRHQIKDGAARDACMSRAFWR